MHLLLHVLPGPVQRFACPCGGVEIVPRPERRMRDDLLALRGYYVPPPGPYSVTCRRCGSELELLWRFFDGELHAMGAIVSVLSQLRV